MTSSIHSQKLDAENRVEGAPQSLIRRAILLVVLAVALFAGGRFGWSWYTLGRFQESTDNAYIEAETAAVASQVEGYVQSVAVRENQPVRRGDLLFTIDPANFQAAVDEAEANVAVQEAALATARADLHHQQATIDQSLAAVANARAGWTRTDKDLKRYQALSRTQFASVQRYDQAVADEAQARAVVAESTASLASARAQVSVLAAHEHQAEAAVFQAKAAVKAVRIDLDRTVVRAPVDGVVGHKLLRPGQFIKSGAQAMVVVPVADAFVIANFKETQVARMRRGMPAIVTVDAYSGRNFAATIDSLAPASGAEFALLPPENATGNFTKIVQRVPVKLVFDANSVRQARLTPGLSVKVTIDIRSQPRAIPEQPSPTATGAGARVAMVTASGLSR